MSRFVISVFVIAVISFGGPVIADTAVVIETFDSGLGNFDTEVNNRANGNNWGWSDTDSAGGSAGEIAGRERRTGDDYICDATIGGVITESDTFIIRGKAWLRNDNADGVLFIGYRDLSSSVDRVGLMLKEPKDYTGGGFRMSLVAGEAESNIYWPVPNDTRFEFDLLYDPNTKALSGTVNGQFITSADAGTAGSFNVKAFGVFDVVGGPRDNYFDFAVDDLQYTVVTAQAPTNPNPRHGQSGVQPGTALSWQGPEDLTNASYEVYFGTDADAIRSATVEDGQKSGDIDQSGRVDGADLALLVQWWLRDPCDLQANPDIDDDGLVDMVDFSLLANDWGGLSAYKGGQSGTIFDPGPLELATTYYWRIDATEGADFRRGNLWRFTTTVLASVEYNTVFAEPGKFAGWPANGGLWSWGDEIVVAFWAGGYVEKEGHNHDGRGASLLGRSTDGGQSWTIEDPDNYEGDGGQILGPPGGIDFAHPDFMMKIWKEPERFWISYDRGHNWEGPYNFGGLMNEPELRGREFTSRTDYIVNGPDDCFIFMSAKPGESGSDVTFTARTTDGGASFQFVSWIVGPSDPYRGVMPSTVRCSPSKLVTAVRRKGGGAHWVDAYVSNDNASSWSFLSRVGDTGSWNGNPPALVRLDDGRLCCAYGNRSDRKIYAKFSDDEGGTWSERITLRDDFWPDSYNDPDLGYPRMAQRPDGKLVTIYYWQTQPQYMQHSESIESTIWQVAPRN